MSNLEQAARQALNALVWHYQQQHAVADSRTVIDREAIADLVAALARQQAEPVADKAQCDGGSCGVGGYCKQCPKRQAEPVAEPVVEPMRTCSLCEIQREDACEILNCGLRDWGKR